MPQPTIKTIEMTRQTRDRIYEQMKDMSLAEQLSFFREHALLINAKAIKRIKTKRKPVRA